MQEKVYKTLEFDKVLLQVADKAVTQRAKNRISAYTPLSNITLLREALAEVKEAVEEMTLKGNLPLRGYREVNEAVIHAQKGGTIRGGALLRISEAIKFAYQVKNYIITKESTNLSCPRLEEKAGEIQSIMTLAKQIDAAIISEDEVSDNASPALRAIRRKIKNANSSLKDKLNSYVHGASGKYLQDGIITMRAGRYVIPVKSEYKNNIDGIVHDTSQSGLTLFIEPQAVVNLNNELKQLETEEAREIEIIFKELSEKVALEALDLICNENMLIALDECFAKASYAYENEHTCPTISEKKVIDLKKARHPLLDRKKAVASDISIGDSYSQIVITGPNTGGKTVTLKTLGLCMLMAQSGLYVPANEGSSVCMLKSIFADIGDEQSIAQSLSTFSSHMVNIVQILKEAEEDSLVLFDELGAGTDPAEGAALAKAILKHIKQRGALSVATTHYNEIKQYALTEPGAVNASVEFDTVNLKPTYRLSIGLPGKSNAFEISRRLGLSDEIIDSAADDMSSHDLRFEEMISSLQEKLSDTQRQNDEARQMKIEAQKLMDELSAQEEKLAASKNAQYAKAITEAKRIIADAKDTARQMVTEAEKYAKGTLPNSADIKSNISEMSREASALLSALMPAHNLFEDEEKKSSHAFKKNDEVFIPQLNAEGVIVEIKGTTALVAVGAIKTKIALGKLEPNKKKKKTSYAYTGMKASSASAKLDIRGITASEVAIEVEKFLDDAALAGLKTVTIVHGKGEGVLRAAVTELLKSLPMVESFRLGGLNEGAGGATIVELN